MSIMWNSGGLPPGDDFRSRENGASGDASQKGPVTVLAVDDDTFFRGLTEALLKKNGYNVITAEDGEDALFKFRTNLEEIHLVILDMMMPGKNGRETYEEIRKLSPGTRVLFASGYTKEHLDTAGMLGEGLDFINKPMTPREFLEKVREVLDRQ